MQIPQLHLLMNSPTREHYSQLSNIRQHATYDAALIGLQRILQTRPNWPSTEIVEMIIWLDKDGCYAGRRNFRPRAGLLSLVRIDSRTEESGPPACISVYHDKSFADALLISHQTLDSEETTVIPRLALYGRLLYRAVLHYQLPVHTYVCRPHAV